MAKIDSLVNKLRADFPAITFTESDDFYWSAPTKTVYFDQEADLGEGALLLHEVGHGLLDHSQFRRDIDLVKMEREAWDYARTTLAPRYSVQIGDDLIENMIDTYREWLHARSTCPACSMTGVQTKDATYHCVGCNHTWRVNEARRCGLKRYSEISN